MQIFLRKRHSSTARLGNTTGLDSLYSTSTMSHTKTVPLSCLFCEKSKPEGEADSTEATSNEAVADGSDVDKDLFWICESCKSSEHERTRALEAALLLENLGVNMTVSPGATVSVATTTEEASRSPGITITSSLIASNSEAKCADADPSPCNCQACAERKHGEMEYEQMREIQDLQKAWVTLRHAVRQLYRDGLLKDGTTTKGKRYDFDKLTYLVNRLCSRDPHQLYQRLESQGREYVMELKVNMLHLLVSSESTAIFGDAKPATDKSLVSQISLAKGTYFLGTLMRSFVKFQQTVRNMSTLFLRQLEVDHLEKFGITWETVNRHLFESMIFQESLIQTSLPIILAQLGYQKKEDKPSGADGGTDKVDVGVVSPTAKDESSSLSEPLADSDRLLSAWPTFERLMNGAKELWDMAQERMEQYTVEQMRVYKATLKAKQKMLKEDLEFFKKQRRLLEEYVNRRKKKVGAEDAKNKSNYTDMATFTAQLRAVLTGAGRGAPKAHQTSPTTQCQNCKALHCPCDECAISHMIACGIISPEDEVEDLDLPLDDEDLIRSLERSPSSSSDISSISDSDDDLFYQGFEDSDFLSEKNARALCTDGEKMSEFRHKMASLLPSTLYTLHDHAESPSVQQHMEHAYGEWETHLDPKARKLAFSHPACELLEKTLEQLNVAGKTDKEKYEIGYQMGVKIATAGLPPDELLKIKGDIIRSHLQLSRKEPNNICTQLPVTATVETAVKQSEAAIRITAVEIKPEKTVVRPRQSSVPTPNGTDKTEVTKVSTNPPNFHSSKIPADILEMLKDEKLSKALSAAAKRVRANGGGPSDFLLEAESIKKIYNSHFTSTLTQEPAKVETKSKELLTVGTQVETAENEEEPDDEDSWSERSEVSGGGGKHCDCCYCEVFGHSNGHLASSNQNYPLIRERLRRKLKQKQCESTTCLKNRKPPATATAAPVKPSDANNKEVLKVKGDESLDALLDFINGGEDKKVEVKVKAIGEKAKSRKGKTKQKKEESIKVDSDDEGPVATEIPKSPGKKIHNSPRRPEEKMSAELDEILDSTDSQWMPVRVKSASINKSSQQSKQEKEKTGQKPISGQQPNDPKNRSNQTTAKPMQIRSSTTPLPKGEKRVDRGGKLPIAAKADSIPPRLRVDKLKVVSRSLSNVDVSGTKKPETNTEARDKLDQLNPVAFGSQNVVKLRTERNLSDAAKKPRPLSATPDFMGSFPSAIDEVFIPKDINLEDLDETEREVESFKRFVFDCPPVQNRAKVNLNIGNILRNLKLVKQNSAASAGCF